MYAFTSKTLRPLISALKPYADTRAYMPALRCVTLRPNCSRMEARATNLETVFSVPCEGMAYNAQTPPVVVALSTLADALKMAGKAGAVTVTPHGVAVNGCMLPLDGVTVDELPSVPGRAAMGEAVRHSVTVERLRAILGAAYCHSTDETRYNLCGVFVGLTANGYPVNGVATDGHRLHVSAMVPDKGGVILPASCLRALRTLADAQNPGAVLTWSSTKTDTRIEAPTGHVVHVRHIDGQFPDYRQVLPRAEDTFRVEFDRAQLAGLCATVKAFLPKADAPGLCLSVCPDSGEAMGAAQRSDWTRYQSAIIPCKAQSPDSAPWLAWGVNVTYLADALASFDGAERVTLAFTDELGPTTVTVPGRDGAAVVMPMRI